MARQLDCDQQAHALFRNGNHPPGYHSPGYSSADDLHRNSSGRGAAPAADAPANSNQFPFQTQCRNSVSDDREMARPRIMSIIAPL